jgi:hypothetical protein
MRQERERERQREREAEREGGRERGGHLNLLFTFDLDVTASQTLQLLEMGAS